MKRVLIFIGLKVVEIVGFGVVIVGLKYLGRLCWLNLWDNSLWSAGQLMVLHPLWGLGIICGLFGSCIIIYSTIKANWKKAGELARKEKK